MNTKDVILEVMEEYTGIEKDELENNMSLNIREEGLIDSVSIAAMLSAFEERFKKNIDTRMLAADDFNSVGSIISAIERIIQLSDRRIK